MVLSGKKPLSCYRIRFAMSSCLLPFPTLCNSPNGSAKLITSHAMSFTRTSGQHLYKTTSSLPGQMVYIWWWMRRVYSEKIISRRPWVHWLRSKVMTRPISMVVEVAGRRSGNQTRGQIRVRDPTYLLNGKPFNTSQVALPISTKLSK